MKTEGARIRKSREADLKRRDQATLKGLALRIARAKAERKHAYQQIAHYCRLGRQNITARVRRLRDEAREALNQKAERLHGRKGLRSSAAERRAESDDEVARNLPAELVAVWNNVKRAIKAGPRKTRTEAFLQWAEENPDVVHEMLYQQAEADVAKLVAEHERVGRRLRKGRKAYDDPAELAHALAGVPF